MRSLTASFAAWAPSFTRQATMTYLTVSSVQLECFPTHQEGQLVMLAVLALTNGHLVIEIGHRTAFLAKRARMPPQLETSTRRTVLHASQDGILQQKDKTLADSVGQVPMSQ